MTHGRVMTLIPPRFRSYALLEKLEEVEEKTGGKQGRIISKVRPQPPRSMRPRSPFAQRRAAGSARSSPVICTTCEASQPPILVSLYPSPLRTHPHTSRPR